MASEIQLPADSFACGSVIWETNVSVSPSGEPPEARTNMSAANACRAPAFSADSHRLFTTFSAFVDSSVNAASETGFSGLALRLNSSVAKRSLMSVRYSTGTVAKTSARTADLSDAPVTAALFAA